MIDSSFAGALIKNGHKTTERKSIIICGPTRGGTSFAASVFYRLGVPFKRDADDKLSIRLEHSELQLAFSAQNWKMMDKTVEDFCYLHLVWGWKVPAIERQLAKVAQMIPNPHAVMIFKEPLSVAARKAIVRKSDLVQRLQEVVNAYGMMAALAASAEYPLLLISYDKAVANLPVFLKVAAHYAGIASYNENAVIAGIQEDQRRYLRATRT
ncbi:MAG: hypothetical protein EPO41_17470 [Reyranella sp.]|uniref:hypothetical protein n=1 Tax=Reyranella sp. TaxID=1929291 RepID=UPI0012136D1E|nr:hypothetical protein [Reyranella sp.]TAJ90730.1 MAG: hypothetical protein EPO41_17470 [Reyranella sp.]